MGRKRASIFDVLMDNNGVIEDRVLRQRYRFTREGDVLTVDLEVDPGGRVPNHFHPESEERWRVIEGDVRFTVGRRKHQPAAGEQIVVAPGIRHWFVNTGAKTAILRAEVEPAAQMQESLEEGAVLNAAVKLAPSGVPKNLTAMLAGAEYAERFRTSIVLVLPFPFPPPALQRLLSAPLASIERKRKSATARRAAGAS
jgi:quercetin dioxygenase-like cupin family protein